MKLTHITALGLCAAAFGVAYGCSSPEADRQPVYITTSGGATGTTTGGKPGTATGGTMQVVTGAGGKVGTGTGGTNGTGGTKAAGSGGTASGSGGANNSNTGGKSTGTGGGNTGGASSGNTGGGNTGGGAALDCATPTSAIVATILKTQKCSDCHNPQSANHPEDFVSAAGLDAVVAGGMADDGACGAGVVITPGDAMMSGLYLRIAGTDTANCPLMPRGKAQAQFSAAQLACVAAWINGLPAQ